MKREEICFAMACSEDYDLRAAIELLRHDALPRMEEEALWHHEEMGFFSGYHCIYSDAWLANEYRLMQEAICPNGGHDWVDDSYGGPESGCMAGHCERCGYSFHTTLY